MRAMVATVVAGPSVLAAPPTMFSLTPSAKAAWVKDMFDYACQDMRMSRLMQGGNPSLDALMRRLGVVRITVDGGIVVFPSKK